MPDLSRIGRIATSLCLLAVSVGAARQPAAHAQDAAREDLAPAEYWKILLGDRAQPRHTLYLTVTPSSGGVGYTGNLSNPARGVVRRSVSDLCYREIAFKLIDADAESAYRARIAADGLSATGWYRIEDTAIPLRMERVGASEAEAAIAGGFDVWRRFAREQAGQIMDVLQLGPGMVVADIGAGRGEWAVTLAERMGPSGHVLATEIDPALLAATRQLMAGVGVTNVTPILGGLDDPGLPDACCDAMLLRLVYHELSDPERMLAGLLRALRPGGIVAVIENPGEGEHRIDEHEVIAGFTAAGFALLRRVDEWQVSGQYCLLFSTAAGN